VEVAGVTDTGERLDAAEASPNHSALRHVERYRWAVPQASGRVLDVACGTGYGTAMLARRCEACGLDADRGALDIAIGRTPGADFRHGELPPIPWPDERFDCVVSFETVEHVEDDAAFVAEIRRVLKPGGILLLSTPNKELTSPDGPPTNPWHVREYRLDDLRALLGGFRDLEVWMQDALPRSAPERLALKFVARFPSLCHPGRWWDRLAHGDGAVEHWDGAAVPKAWVLRARR
jgi:SAM-dependent methyltransferase